MSPSDTEVETARIRYQDLLRTGPGTLAGRYLRMFWQPVFRSEDLKPGRAKPIRIMSEDFTLFRGETGAAHVVANRCAHRGSQLSTGTVEGDAIRCLYHGWTYDSNGQCIDQPAEPKPFCDRIRIKSYPTEEYLGMVFTYLGEDEPPPLPRYPEFERPEYLLFMSVSTWRSNYFTQLENSLDYAHGTFVHKQWQWGIPTITAQEVDGGVEVHVEGATEEPDYGYFSMPNAHEYATPPQVWWGTGARSFARGWRVPVDDYHHLRLDPEIVPLTGDAARHYVETRAADEARRQRDPVEIAESILAGDESLSDILKDPWALPAYDLINIEDHVALAGLGPIADEPPKERLGRTDSGVTLIRKRWRRELQALREGRPVKREWPRPAQLWANVTEADTELESAQRW